LVTGGMIDSLMCSVRQGDGKSARSQRLRAPGAAALGK
jgi:hypothetical protein